MTALGLIETKGLLAAVEAADAMLKAAEVHLLEKNLAGGGLVTITVCGEVAAVKASVEAGAASVKRISEACLVSEHIIARPDVDLANIVALKPKPEDGVACEGTPCEPRTVDEKDEPVAERTTAAADVITAVSPLPEPEEKAPAVEVSPVRHEISQLKKMSVDKLRQIAGTLEGISIDREQVAFVDKKSLIETIINAYRQREE